MCVQTFVGVSGTHACDLLEFLHRRDSHHHHHHRLSYSSSASSFNSSTEDSHHRPISIHLPPILTQHHSQDINASNDSESDSCVSKSKISSSHAAWSTFASVLYSSRALLLVFDPSDPTSFDAIQHIFTSLRSLYTQENEPVICVVSLLIEGRSMDEREYERAQQWAAVECIQWSQIHVCAELQHDFEKLHTEWLHEQQSVAEGRLKLAEFKPSWWNWMCGVDAEMMLTAQIEEQRVARLRLDADTTSSPRAIPLATDLQVDIGESTNDSPHEEVSDEDLLSYASTCHSPHSLTTTHSSACRSHASYSPEVEDEVRRLALTSMMKYSLTTSTEVPSTEDTPLHISTDLLPNVPAVFSPTPCKFQTLQLQLQDSFQLHSRHNSQTVSKCHSPSSSFCNFIENPFSLSTLTSSSLSITLESSTAHLPLTSLRRSLTNADCIECDRQHSCSCDSVSSIKPPHSTVESVYEYALSSASPTSSSSSSSSSFQHHAIHSPFVRFNKSSVSSTSSTRRPSLEKSVSLTCISSDLIYSTTSCDPISSFI